MIWLLTASSDSVFSSFYFHPCFIQLVSAGDRIKSLEIQRIILLMLAVILLLIAVYFMLSRRGKAANSGSKKAVENKSCSSLEVVESYFKGQEDEMARVGKELHDGACSAILGVRYLLAPHALENPDIKKASEWLLTVHSDLRSMSHNLASRELFQANLDEALELLLSRLCTQAGKDFTFSTTSNSSWDCISKTLQHNIYRIVQELLGNILKHSDASRVELVVSLQAKSLSISIEDNSTNYQPQESSGMGLGSIQSRLKLINGAIEVFKTKEGAVYHLEATDEIKHPCTPKAQVPEKPEAQKT